MKKKYVILTGLLCLLLIVGVVLFALHNKSENISVKLYDGNLLPDDFTCVATLVVEASVDTELDDGESVAVPLGVKLETGSQVHEQNEHDLLAMTLSMLGQSFTYRSNSYYVNGVYPLTYIQATQNGSSELSEWHVLPGRYFNIDVVLLRNADLVDVHSAEWKESRGWYVKADTAQFCDMMELKELILSFMNGLSDMDEVLLEESLKQGSLTYHFDDEGRFDSLQLSNISYTANGVYMTVTWTFYFGELDDVTEVSVPRDVVNSAVVGNADSVFGDDTPLYDPIPGVSSVEETIDDGTEDDK